MAAIVKIIGVLSAAVGAAILAYAAWLAFQFRSPEAFSMLLLAVSSILSGALLYCFGSMVDLLRATVMHLEVIQRQGEEAARKPVQRG